MNEMLKIDVHPSDGGSTVVAAGEIDMAVTAQLRSCLEVLTGTVVVDLTAVTFLDSSGIGVLVAQQNRLTASGGQLVLSGPSDTVRRTLEVVGLKDWIAD